MNRLCQSGTPAISRRRPLTGAVKGFLAASKLKRLEVQKRLPTMGATVRAEGVLPVRNLPPSKIPGSPKADRQWGVA